MLAQGQGTSETEFNRGRTMSLGIVIFPGFQPLDVYGPLEMFFGMSFGHKISLSFIAKERGPVSSGYPPHKMAPGEPPMDMGHMLQPSGVAVVATHTFADAPALDVLLVPGGLGDRALEDAGDTSVEDFVARRFAQLDYLLSTCTGAVFLAKAGVLNGRRATTNKGAWSWAVTHGENVTWVPAARWVQDGKVWTSSGVSAGLDMTYAFLRHFYGEDDSALETMMNGIEYAPHTDPDWDPFSVVHKVSDRLLTIEG
ncbi:hypothetical protein DL766_009008 [Monosporascus sp. MC13-8B]|uniref:DJ-1/PfpI domain-containing protein n=1 Tax=Monosporascus cannonballus TaxID=155416 RepID=A0ABY0GYJ0_9PEZI|nr:hypothetical protein DL762_008765 [Monosporascus cannonballus]RYO88115.1 hypothetical protein DL763_006138 [Monosporascus cannonballus]RYP16892.1 hypothetical protein DL766_009008 [Monosporascus sp. MC13-8B]